MKDESEEVLGLRLPHREYDRIETAVVDLYTKLQVTNVPVDVFSIVKQMGWEAKPYSELPYDAVQKLRESHSDGCSFFNPTLKQYVICYDDHKPMVRVRFTIMHEVGHIVLDHKQESDLANQMANHFAAYSLAPTPLIGCYKCEDYIEGANIFNVSRECASICFQRYMNWFDYGGDYYKPYEIKLRRLFFPNDEDVTGSDYNLFSRSTSVVSGLQTNAIQEPTFLES